MVLGLCILESGWIGMDAGLVERARQAVSKKSREKTKTKRGPLSAKNLSERPSTSEPAGSTSWDAVRNGRGDGFRIHKARG